MYNLFYWYMSATLMCTFTNKKDCKKALETLQTKYPKAKIWYEQLETIDSYEDWLDEFEGKIKDYN